MGSLFDAVAAEKNDRLHYQAFLYSFLAPARKEPKEAGTRGAVRPCSRTGSRPLVYPPAASPAVPEHLNLDSVQAENVPIFCLKFGLYRIGRAARARAAAISKTIRPNFSVVKVLGSYIVRAGRFSRGRIGLREQAVQRLLS